jgi:hypothetical protein
MTPNVDYPEAWGRAPTLKWRGIMAGQTIVNFDGLTAEAADKLAKGMVDAARVKIETIAAVVEKLSTEDAIKVERLFGGKLVADGNCGNGCA